MTIVDINSENYHQVVEIYLEGIKTGVATFETNAPPWEKWNEEHFDFGRIAAYENGKMLGWAALSPVSGRCVYGGVAELSIYIREKERGKGIGRFLMNELIRISEANEIWTMQAGVFSVNMASIVLHEKCGFRLIGYREKIGKLHGVWHDNVLLERRSKKVGI